MTHSIVLIGAPRTGKTTVGRLLAQSLGLPFVDLEADNQRYIESTGVTDSDFEAHWRAGYDDFYAWLKPLEAAALEHGLAKHPDSIIEVRPAQAVYEDAALLERARLALEPYPLVVRLVPDDDVERSLEVIGRRSQLLFRGVELNEHFVRDPSNAALATITAYTAGQTPEQTAEHVLGRLDPDDPTVVLIGPMSAGKSSIGELLAERLGRPAVALDELRWSYYNEIGFSEEAQSAAGAAEGFVGVYRYWKPFELHAVERVLAEHAGSVIHFGAGHSVFYEPEHQARSRAALAPFRNVVLLLPSPDADESVAVLRERTTLRVGGVELNRYLLTHPSAAELAKQTVVTAGKTPEQTRDAILGLAQRRSGS